MLTAERIFWRGRFVADAALKICAAGKVEAFGPVSRLGPPTHDFGGRILLPGLVDPFAPGCFVDSKKTEFNDNVLEMLIDAQQGSPKDLEASLTEQMWQRAKRGVTCLGLPYMSFRRLGEPVYQWVDTVARAMKNVGIRVAFLDTIDEAVGQNEAFEHFLGLVNYLVAIKDPRLSWALWLAHPEEIGMETHMALKLRLGHLPMLLGGGYLDREKKTSKKLEKQISSWEQAGLLDTMSSVVVDERIGQNTRQILHKRGCTSVELVGGFAPATFPNTALASGLNPKADLLSIRPDVNWADLLARQQAGAASLSLNSFGTAVEQWADFITVPFIAAKTCQSGLIVPHMSNDVCDVLVAGKTIVSDGKRIL